MSWHHFQALGWECHSRSCMVGCWLSSLYSMFIANMLLAVKRWEPPKSLVFGCKVKPMATCQYRRSFYCHHKGKEVHCKDTGREGNINQGWCKCKSRPTKMYTLTQLCKNTHVRETGTRMWGLIETVLKCPVKTQNLIKLLTIGSSLHFISIAFSYDQYSRIFTKCMFTI